MTRHADSPLSRIKSHMAQGVSPVLYLHQQGMAVLLISMLCQF